MKNYISNGRVSREEIAADIRDGVLKREDIKALVSNPDIQKAFIGQNYSKKVSQDMWTKTYLNKLPYLFELTAKYTMQPTTTTATTSTLDSGIWEVKE